MSNKEMFLAQFGSEKHQDKLVHSPDTAVRKAVALNGTNGHRHQLVNDDSHPVVAAVLKKSPRKEYLDKLVNHHSPYFRDHVAEHGHEEHHDVLMHDKDHSVRVSVASNGSDKHRDHLQHDEHFSVRAAVAKHGNLNHVSRLMGDENPMVRRIAKHRYQHLDAPDSWHSDD